MSSRSISIRMASLTALTALAVAALTMAAPDTARASEATKKAARPYYEKGASEYNLGHFVEAIAEFEKAYGLDPAPILLFNIAQAHRQMGSNERAAFFYRRYLEQAPTAPNRADVEKRIKDLDEVMRQQTEVKRRPPTEVAGDAQSGGGNAATAGGATTPPPVAGTMPAGTTQQQQQPTGATGTTALPASEVPPEAGVSSGAGAGGPPLRIRLWASLGPSFPSFSGGRSLEQPTLLSVRVGGGYAFDLGKAGVVDAGLSLAYAPVPYRMATTDLEKGAAFWGLLATGTYRRQLIPALEVSVELGGGVIWWSGLDEDNPFTEGGVAASGAVPMPSFLFGLGAAYHITRPLFVFAQPTFLYSKTTGGESLTAVVSSVTRFDLAIGVGYSL